MAITTLQSLEMCVARLGVRVTGTNCMAQMPAGSFQAPILSLPWHSLPGLFPIRRGAEADAEDNSAMAQAIHRAGRSAVSAGVTHASYQLMSYRPTRLKRTAHG